MTAPESLPLPCVEAALTKVFATPVAVTAIERPGPWAVIRAYLQASPPGRPVLPASVVVKWLREHPAGFRIDPCQTHTEQAALT